MNRITLELSTLGDLVDGEGAAPPGTRVPSLPLASWKRRLVKRSGGYYAHGRVRSANLKFPRSR